MPESTVLLHRFLAPVRSHVQFLLAVRLVTQVGGGAAEPQPLTSFPQQNKGHHKAMDAGYHYFTDTLQKMQRERREKKLKGIIESND